MAFRRGVKMKELQADTLQKLNSNGEILQNSTSSLLHEMNILSKLIYKSKNSHSKEKFFKCLERIKKCLRKWKLLDLDKKVIAMHKNVGETKKLYEILNEIKIGGQLAIRVIVLCQETIQYNLAYVSRGFFVTLHVTLLSLVSRMWVLQKDCWTGLVECYQLVRSLVLLTENHINLNKFPESLTLSLSEEVKEIFDGKCIDDAFSVVSSRNLIFHQLFSENNDSDAPSMSKDEEDNDEFDLGEPVEDRREFHSEDKNHHSTPTLTHDKTVSARKTNLTLKFDLESAVYKNIHENDLESAMCENFDKNESSKIVKQNAKIGTFVEDATSKDSHKIKSRCKLDELGKRKAPLPVELRKSDNKLVVRRLRRSLHSRENTFFIKKTPCRYTLRSLLATVDFADCPTKRLHALLKFLSFAWYSRDVLPNEQRILLRIQRSLQRELRKRRRLKNRRKEDGISFSGKTDRHKECNAPGMFRKTCTVEERSEVTCREKKDEQKFATRRKTDANRVNPIDLKCILFSKESQKDTENQSKNIKRDEIDDIFSSLGL